MPIFEYILLAMLGSGGPAASLSPATQPAVLGAESIVQPNGAAAVSNASDLNRNKVVKTARAHRRVRRHRRNTSRHGIG